MPVLLRGADLLAYSRQDPANTSAEYKDDLNRYVGNNPIDLTDPSGMIASTSENFARSSTAAAANVVAQSSTGGKKLDCATIGIRLKSSYESAPEAKNRSSSSLGSALGASPAKP